MYRVRASVALILFACLAGALRARRRRNPVTKSRLLSPGRDDALERAAMQLTTDNYSDNDR